jgi:hypothetical protein
VGKQIRWTGGGKIIRIQYTYSTENKIFAEGFRKRIMLLSSNFNLTGYHDAYSYFC